uniref:AMP deaminase n=1 Tax=Ditylenchus dipsaci TaxID=166011 RepID=A0A915D7C7_9BILA
MVFPRSSPSVNFFLVGASGQVAGTETEERAAASATNTDTEEEQEEKAVLTSMDSEIFDNSPSSRPLLREQEAMQRQISNRRARMDPGPSRGSNTPSTERNSQCVSPQSPCRSMTSLGVDVGPVQVPEQVEVEEEEGGSQIQSQTIEMHTFRDAIDVNYQRMALTEEELSGIPLEDLKAAAKFLVEGLMSQEEHRSFCPHFFHPPEPPSDHWGISTPLPVYDTKYVLKRQRGCVAVLDQDGKIAEEMRNFYISKEKYLKDYSRIINMIADGPLKSFSYRRLTFLQTKFQLHVLLNDIRELHEQKSVPHRDFYNIRKVDTHIHAASSMNQKHLLRFIKKKMKTEADEVVHEQNGKKNTFHRFDKFNTKYNPVGQSILRDVFIKTDNYVGGKYFAEVLKEVFSDLEDSKYQQAEPRLSIYGRSKDEWDKLAKWAIKHDVWSTNIRWIIQVPRLFDVYKTKNMIANFDEFLDNVFSPLFEVTNDPSSHPELHCFLQYVTAMDSVDDESKHEYVHFDLSTPEPEDYTTEENPPYSFYLHYMFANLTALNSFRRLRGLNTIALKTHCGEAGHINHLVVGFLTSESIAHGLLLRKVPVLQYLFYLSQIGIAMSPLKYLMKGLNVSLSTDDPLQFHFTKEALMRSSV